MHTTVKKCGGCSTELAVFWILVDKSYACLSSEAATRSLLNLFRRTMLAMIGQLAKLGGLLLEVIGSVWRLTSGDSTCRTRVGRRRSCDIFRLRRSTIGRTDYHNGLEKEVAACEFMETLRAVVAIGIGQGSKATNAYERD